MFHSWILGLGFVAVVTWLMRKFFGAAISNFVSKLFSDSPDEQQLRTWRSDVRGKASRLIHIWESHDAREYADRKEMQDAFVTARDDLDSLLAESPRLAKNKEERLIREVLAACDGIEDLEIKEKWAPVNLDNPDEDVTTIGKSKDEIIQDFSAQGENIASQARDLRDHIEDVQSSGILPFR